MADHNPYSNDAGFDELAGPERTSLLAIMSLVMSLICCIPGLGLLGAGLGVGSLIGISGSRGRVGGKGLATAGIIIGVLITVAWVGFAATAWSGVKEAVKEVYTPMHEVMADIESGSYDKVRIALAGSPLASTTDEQFEAFRSAYRAEVGSFVEIPTEPGGLWNAYMEVGPQMQGFQQPADGQTVLIPIPASFDQAGMVVIMATMTMDQSGQAQDPLEMFSKFSIVLPDGSEIELEAPQAAPLPQGGGGEDAAPADDDGP